ncbi:hypothetical protein BAE44_0003010 [Dichanthelium oligosanthes]|uniref:Uncharacterized protein n=1 Tax=Dichanthelium oligosanthes TaxID=888268 RepID=A0A1E5WFB5_9POAL|nr:hypothetical protein BAE44_0003010 [Dichanthelium oligosanthes]
MGALGVVEDLKILKNRLEYMKSVLADAEVKRVHDSAINTWPNQLKDVMYDADDLIDLCSIKSQKSSHIQPSSMLNQRVCHKVPPFSCLGDFQFNCEIGYKIKDINERLEKTLKDRVMLRLERIIPEQISAPNVDIRQTDALPDDVVGADIVNNTNEMVQKLVAYRDADEKIGIFGIEGMPGIGKTTLAKKIYNDPRIEKELQLRIWLCVTETFDEINLLKQMIQEAGGSTGQQSTKAELIKQEMEMVEIFKEIAIKIVLKCNGLPLAIKVRRLGIANVGERLPVALTKIARLRTLVLFDSPKFSTIDDELFRRLKHLRVLILSETSISAVPKSVKNLLNELQSLSQLRRLRIDKLERVEVAGVVLKDKTKLKELSLGCTIDRSRTDEARRGTNDGQRTMTRVYENLVPPPNLSHLFIHGFLGTLLPTWLITLSLDIFRNLYHLHLNDCIWCPQIPPVGQLPDLLVLKIKGADAVVKLDTDLFGQGIKEGEQIIFFPKLELCHIFDMYNLECWSLNTEELCRNMQVNPQQIILMPHLKRLMLINCPKLRALPDGLSNITSLQRIQIEGADRLEEITNLPAVLWLKVKNNKSLKRVSNLRNLRNDCLPKIVLH